MVQPPQDNPCDLLVRLLQLLTPLAPQTEEQRGQSSFSHTFSSKEPLGSSLEQRRTLGSDFSQFIHSLNVMQDRIVKTMERLFLALSSDALSSESESQNALSHKAGERGGEKLSLLWTGEGEGGPSSLAVQPLVKQIVAEARSAIQTLATSSYLKNPPNRLILDVMERLQPLVGLLIGAVKKENQFPLSSRKAVPEQERGEMLFRRAKAFRQEEAREGIGLFRGAGREVEKGRDLQEALSKSRTDSNLSANREKSENSQTGYEGREIARRSVVISSGISKDVSSQNSSIPPSETRPETRLSSEIGANNSPSLFESKAIPGAPFTSNFLSSYAALAKKKKKQRPFDSMDQDEEKEPGT